MRKRKKFVSTDLLHLESLKEPLESPGQREVDACRRMIQAPPQGKAAQQRVPSQRQARRNPDLIRMMALVAVKDIGQNYKTPRRDWQREVFHFEDWQSLPF